MDAKPGLEGTVVLHLVDPSRNFEFAYGKLFEIAMNGSFGRASTTVNHAVNIPLDVCAVAHDSDSDYSCISILILVSGPWSGVHVYTDHQ